MTKKQIEITFQNAIAQARQLDDCADNMMRLSGNNLGAVRTDLLAAWEGAEANAFVDKLDMTGENIVKTANKLYAIADTIRSVARIFRDSELKALEIAEQRTY